MDSKSKDAIVTAAPGLNAVAWLLQVFLAIQYAMHGLLFISPPAAMVDAMAGMGISTAFRQFIGIAEVLAAIGLVLPGLTRILPGLVPLAAFGLTIVMVSATIYHVGRNEVPSAFSTVNLLALVAVTAYLRWRVVPIRSRAAG